MSNPLIEELSSSLPGVAIALPTMGRYYPRGVLRDDADVEEISVNCLTMVDEIKFRDPYLLASGQGMKSMISRICPDVVDPDQLCDIDIEAIVLAARIASYGDTLPIHVKCQNPALFEQLDPDTGEPDGVTYPLCEREDDMIVSLTELMMKYAPFEDEFSFVLSPYGQTVTLQPLTHRGALKLTRTLVERQRDLRRMEELQSQYERDEFDEEALDQYMRIVDLSISLTTDLIVDAIHSVTTSKGEVVKDKSTIEAWLARLPSDRIKEINSEINDMIDWLREMSSITYTCSCGHTNKVPIVLDADKLFLSAPEASPVQMKSSGSSPVSERKPTKRSRSLPR